MMQRWVGPALAVTLLVVYLAAPVCQTSDSHYSLLLTHSLVYEGSFDLARYLPSGPEAETPYQIRWVRAHAYYDFPVGGSVLAAPFVWLARATTGLSVARKTEYSRHGEEQLERVLAALVTATWAWIVYATARLWLGPGASAALALAAGLGTQAMSTTSRALWSDTWALMLLQLALLGILRRWPAVVAGTILSWVYFAKPTYSLGVLIAIALVGWLRGARYALVVVALGGAWLAAFVAFALSTYGTPVPPYYSASRLTFDAAVIERLVGLLLSPGRGLLVYLPVLVVLPLAVMLAWRHVPSRAFAVLAVVAVTSYVVVTAGFPHWWGGWSYGPRLLTGALPWLVIVAALAACGIRATPRRLTRTALLVPLGVAAALGIAIHTHGAFSEQSWRWNALPVAVDEQSARLWDWSDPQFLAALHPR